MNKQIIRTLTVLAASGTLAGCTTGFWQSVAEAETFNFRYAIGTPLASSGNYTYQIAMDNGPCQPVSLTDAELKTMIETGVHVHAGVSYNFTPDMLTPCNTGRYYLDDEDIKTLRNGIPKKVDVNRVGGGANPSGLDIRVDASQMVVYNSGGPLAPGPLAPTPGGTFEIPAHIVTASGPAISPLNSPANTRVLQFNLIDTLSNPDRITAEFLFVGRQSGSNLRVMVWDGEILLQE